MFQLDLKQIKEIKNAYLNYGFEFWAWKKCSHCKEYFTLENYSQKQIELVLCRKSGINEYSGSEGAEVTWYHKACLVHWTKKLEEIERYIKNNSNGK